MTSSAWTHVFIDVPADLADPARRFWADVTGWTVGGPWDGHPDFTSLVPPSGDAYVHVQTVGSDPRVHIDLATEDIDAARSRLIGLGADEGQRMPEWQVMSSPGGLPFCLAHEPQAHEVPSAVTWPDGHRSRLGQVCIDAPAAVHEREHAFWQELTGWREKPSDSAEFDGKLYPPQGGTVQLLLQRLGDDDPADETRAHIDLVTDDLDAEVDRVIAHGARLVDAGLGRWVVLEDPLGLPFCVTYQPDSL